MIKKSILIFFLTLLIIVILVFSPFFMFTSSGSSDDKLHTDKDYTQSAYGFMNPLDPIRITNDWGGYSAIEQYDTHPAIDFACAVGEPLVAPTAGTIYQAGYGWDKYGAMTLWLRTNKDRNLTILYAHVSQVYVKKGDEVKQGQVIAACGNTGLSTGSHLHMEVDLKGVPVNPHNYFKFK